MAICFVCKECSNWCLAGAVMPYIKPDHCLIAKEKCNWVPITEEDVKYVKEVQAYWNNSNKQTIIS